MVFALLWAAILLVCCLIIAFYLFFRSARKRLLKIQLARDVQIVLAENRKLSAENESWRMGYASLYRQLHGHDEGAYTIPTESKEAKNGS